MSWEFCTCQNMREFRSIYNVAADYFKQGEAVDIQIRKHESKRKDAQNALQFHWFRELEMQGDKSAEEYRAECKLRIGVPIAREDDGFRQLYDKALKGLDYATKLALMQEPIDIPVTRHFTVKEMARYLKGIEAFAAHQGFALTSNHDLYLQAVGE